MNNLNPRSINRALRNAHRKDQIRANVYRNQNSLNRKSTDSNFSYFSPELINSEHNATMYIQNNQSSSIRKNIDRNTGYFNHKLPKLVNSNKLLTQGSCDNSEEKIIRNNIGQELKNNSKEISTDAHNHQNNNSENRLTKINHKNFNFSQELIKPESNERISQINSKNFRFSAISSPKVNHEEKNNTQSNIQSSNHQKASLRQVMANKRMTNIINNHEVNNYSNIYTKLNNLGYTQLLGSGAHGTAYLNPSTKRVIKILTPKLPDHNAIPQSDPTPQRIVRLWNDFMNSIGVKELATAKVITIDNKTYLETPFVDGRNYDYNLKLESDELMYEKLRNHLHANEKDMNDLSKYGNIKIITQDGNNEIAVIVDFDAMRDYSIKQSRFSKRLMEHEAKNWGMADQHKNFIEYSQKLRQSNKL